jgi:hypothetical protein
MSSVVSKLNDPRLVAIVTGLFVLGLVMKLAGRVR